MIICNYNNSFNYELEKLTRLFMPFERIDVIDHDVQNERKAITATEYSDKGCRISAIVSIDGVTAADETFLPTCDDFIKMSELKLAGCLFNCLAKIFSYAPKWGILTGVRPARLFLAESQKRGIKGAFDYFTEVLRVDPAKLLLLDTVSKSEESIIQSSKSDSFSLYISIPFCPTRCSYCSFVSHSVQNASDIIPDYLNKLYVEIEDTAQIIKNLGLRLETVYIGGGTPTTLSANDLEELISFIISRFDISTLREFTVEAGRPDTISKEKLVVLINNAVTRISINPQTLNDDVLSIIGRKHSSGDFLTAFNLAREIGFKNINTDLIAGLPTESFESFKTTINKIIDLAPESVTVHSLSMKRASALTANGFEPLIEEGKLAARMVDYAKESLINKDFLPYYMYRQSKTVGNLENVGYAKQGFEGLYNVFIMDETHSVFACGASAATKLKNQKNGQIKRIFNFKYPYEYIGRFDEQIARKKQIYDFYKSL